MTFTSSISPATTLKSALQLGKSNCERRKGKFIRYTDAIIEVDGESVHITTKNVLKVPCS